jgi:hypothetical protein
MAIAGLLYVIHALYLWHFAIDDVGISYRYAHHLATGQGLTWNPGQEPVEGYSNFLWVLILAAGKFLGFDIVITSKVLGFALGIAALSVLTLVSHALWALRSFWWLPPMLVAVTPEWAAWSMSGLEIALYGFLLSVGLYAIVANPRLRTLLLSVTVSGLTLTRPEGAGIGALLLLLAVRAGTGPSGTWTRVKAHMFPIAMLLLTVAALLAFRFAYFGFLFPNTVYAKFDTSLPSMALVLSWFVFCTPFFLALLMLRGESKQNAIPVIGISVIVLAQMLITLPVKPVMYFVHRYQIAFLPLIALLAPLILWRVGRRNRYAGVILAAALAAWCMQGWPEVIRRFEQDRYVAKQQTCVAESLSRLPGRPTIAVVDAGRIPYLSGLPAIDAWGLCDVEIAREGFAPHLVLSRRPEVYILSVDVRSEGKDGGIDLRTHLGMDIMTTKLPEFSQRYGLWTLCTSGTTPHIGDSALAYYDYGVFLDSVWANQVGIAGRLIHVDWPY